MVRKSFIVVLLVSCTGCLTNNYEKYYVDSAEGRNLKSTHGDASVILKTATTEDDVLSIIEDGYVPSGTSSFSGRYTPFSCAVDTAKKHGAALVLLDVRFKETKQYTSVMFLPSYSTTYSSGAVNTTTYGSGGVSYGTGTYSGTSSTTTMNAVPVQREIDIYNHDAMFFKKIELSQTYGIKWFVPKRLPTEKSDSPILVRVLAVFHGTEAEKKGIKRGQIVKTINGIPIKTRQDIAPFLSNETVIKDVEVADAQ